MVDLQGGNGPAAAPASTASPSAPEGQGEARRDGNTAAGERRPVGVVLAGGRSRRMGRDKALLPWHGRSLVDHAVALLAGSLVDVAVADGGRSYLADRLSLPDDPKAAGPAAGLLAAANAFPGRPVLALACDLPRVPPALLELLAEADPEFDWVVPAGERGLEPLCSRFGPGALDRMAERARRGRFDLVGLLGEPGLRIRMLGRMELARLGVDQTAFDNLNRPEDLSLE